MSFKPVNYVTQEIVSQKWKISTWVCCKSRAVAKVFETTWIATFPGKTGV
jgi:hypothetical protein